MLPFGSGARLERGKPFGIAGGGRASKVDCDSFFWDLHELMPCSQDTPLLTIVTTKAGEGETPCLSLTCCDRDDLDITSITVNAMCLVEYCYLVARAVETPLDDQLVDVYPSCCPGEIDDGICGAPALPQLELADYFIEQHHLWATEPSLQLERGARPALHTNIEQIIVSVSIASVLDLATRVTAGEPSKHSVGKWAIEEPPELCGDVDRHVPLRYTVEVIG